MRTTIKSLSTSAGYLEHAQMDFADGLNCIIGSRGTCKSTIVETLRFLFNCDVERVRLLTEDVQGSTSPGDSPSSRGLIRASLKDGTARCTVLRGPTGGDDETLLIERSIDSSPRVYREGVQEAGSTETLDCIEIYSQGDLQRIAERPSLRLRLIDRPNQDRINILQAEREKTSSLLQDIGPRIRRLRNEMDASRSEIRGLDSYRRDLEAIQASRPSLSPELTTEREAFEARNSLTSTLSKLGTDRVEILADIIRLTRNHIQFSDGAARLSGFNHEEAHILMDRLTALADFLRRIHAEASQLREDAIGPSLEALKNRFERDSESYFSIRRQEQEASDSLRREDALKQQIAKMVTIEQKVNNLQEQLSILLRERQELRSRLESTGEELYRLRIDQVENINSDFGNVVLLTLRQGEESTSYRTLINALLQGSRIRNQEEVAIDIASNVLPSDLIDIVESGDAKRLADTLSRDLGQMTRLVSFLLDSPRLYDLEGVLFDDWLEITMYISGEPKPISQLSKGQMATALLPLILRSASYPLIFDQPEDDLDNAFIFTTLISKVRELKSARQIIFVTHNANIPVLGDADRILVMSMKNPQKANPPLSGTVDEARVPILTLLEGGAEAFRLRQRKYGDLLSSD